MSLFTELKTRVTAAMKAKNELERDTFRFILGELQRSNTAGDPTDEQVVKAVKKVIEGNAETLKVCPPTDDRFTKLTQENELLSTLLPKEWDAKTIEAFFLNHDDPIFEQIRDAKNDGQATGVAMKTLKAVNAPVDGKVVGEVVKKIRANNG